ncbi:hypothetical protein [Streptomyces sp. NPDC059142]|uniref:hypothetical protein n=1 Tax=Streptomyces sp. NPDC059142 TaxID=3346739 RepID=UPI0036955FD2
MAVRPVFQPHCAEQCQDPSAAWLAKAPHAGQFSGISVVHRDIQDLDAALILWLITGC